MDNHIRGRLILTQPLVFIHVDSTGVKIAEDRIVAISMLKIFPDGHEEKFYSLVNPEKAIPYEATAVSGINDEMVSEAPTFRELAASVATFINGCDLAGYNIRRFALPLLAEEFIIADYPIALKNYRVVDVQVIFHKHERRNLEGAYKFYCDKELDDAHSAIADTRACIEVLKGQLQMYSDLPGSVEALHQFSKHLTGVDLAARLVYDMQGRELFNFGMFKGRIATEVYKEHPDYFDWLLRSDFANDTKNAFRRVMIKADTDKNISSKDVVER